MNITASVPIAIALGAAIALALLLGWRRLRDPITGVLSLLAGVALWALLVDLRSAASGTSITVRTPGVPLTGGIAWAPSQEGAIRSLLELPPGAASIEVTGFGLPGAAWDEARVLPVAFDPPAPPPGLHDLQWSHRVVTGESVVIAGAVTPPADEVRIRAGGVTLATASPDSDGRFVLRFDAGAPGRRLLTLEAGAGSQVSDREQLAVTVEEPPVVRVDGQLGAPSADLRALRDWLVSAGSVRGELTTALAPGVERREHIGPAPEEDATASALPDLLIVDTREPGVAERITNALDLATRGAGVLILYRGGSLPAAAGFTIDPPAGDGEISLTVAGASLVARRTGLLLETESLRIERRDTKGRSLIASRPHGAGTVAVSLLEGTGGWVTAGHQVAHDAFWSQLLRGLGRARPATLAFDHSERVATVGMRTDLCRRGSPAPPDQRDIVSPAPAIPLLVAHTTEDWHCLAWWPDIEGWHEVGESWVHVYPESSFWPDRARARTAATRARLVAGVPDAAREPVPLRSVWWLLFLAGAVAGWWRARTIA